jgi:hypothetical protein
MRRHFARCCIPILLGLTFGCVGTWPGVAQAEPEDEGPSIFPDKPVQAGIWSGLDEKSGATYTLSCRPL